MIQLTHCDLWFNFGTLTELQSALNREHYRSKHRQGDKLNHQESEFKNHLQNKQDNYDYDNLAWLGILIPSQAKLS